MVNPEGSLDINNPAHIAYLDGLKDELGSVIDFDFLIKLKPQASFEGFMEGIEHIWPSIEYAGKHVTDPNWYSEGKYKTGVLELTFYLQLQEYFRTLEQGAFLEEDQCLGSLCHFSENPGEDRGNMIIDVHGGEWDDNGQFLDCWVDRPFLNALDLVSNRVKINDLKKLAGTVGKQETSRSEYRQQLTQRLKAREEKWDKEELY